MKLLKGLACLAVFVALTSYSSAVYSQDCWVTEVAQSTLYGGTTADKCEVYCATAQTNVKCCDGATGTESCSAAASVSAGSYYVFSRGTYITTTDLVGVKVNDTLQGTAVGAFNIASGTSQMRCSGKDDQAFDAAGTPALGTGTSCSSCTPDCTGLSCGASDGCSGTCGSTTDNGCPCTDNLYCNGTDTYSSGTCSVHTGDPCTPQTCYETTDTCGSNGPGSIEIIPNNPECTGECDPSGGMESNLVSRILSATSTVDCQVYGFDNPAIKTALIDADQGGTTVRFVTDDENSDPASKYYQSVQDLISGGVDVKYVNSSGIMHTKYCIIDSTDVISGTANFTTTCIPLNHNFMVNVLGSPNTVTAFQCNFNESWNYCDNGTNGSCAPSQRVDNCNNSNINVSGTTMEVCFSPQGSCMSRLNGSATHTSGFTGTCASAGTDCDLDSSADSGEGHGTMVCADYKYTVDGVSTDRHSCDSCNLTGTLPASATTRMAISVFFFTDACAAKGVVENSISNSSKILLWDALGAKNAYSMDAYICNAGINVYIENWAGKNHSKVGVFDNSIIMGSMNWSANGDAGNDEQTLVIHNSTLATQVYNKISAEKTALVNAGVSACTQQGTEVCTDGSDNDYNGLVDYCDPGCGCNAPATDCRSCTTAPTGGIEEPGIGGGAVDCNVTPTDPYCVGTGTGVVPAGYTCETTCIDTSDGSCYCTSTDSTDFCYDANCDPSKAALSCVDNGNGTYKCTSTGTIDTGLLRNATVTFKKVAGVMQEVRTNTAWYALDGAGLVYEQFWCESPHPYTNNCGYGVSGCVNDAKYFCQAYRSNATKIATWFAGVDTEACLCNDSGVCKSNGTYTCAFDYIDLKNSSGTHVAYYGGPVTAGSYLYGWSAWVTGTTANLYLDTDTTVTDWGFAVSALVYQPPSSSGGTADTGAGGGTTGASCTTNADCATGLTCQKVKGVYICK